MFQIKIDINWKPKVENVYLLDTALNRMQSKIVISKDVIFDKKTSTCANIQTAG
jgi:hypothetical protein